MLLPRREKLAAVETKLKAAVQDKTNVGMEKAALERELKGLRGQAGRLTKVPRSCSRPLITVPVPRMLVSMLDSCWSVSLTITDGKDDLLRSIVCPQNCLNVRKFSESQMMMFVYVRGL